MMKKLLENISINNRIYFSFIINTIVLLLISAFSLFSNHYKNKNYLVIKKNNSKAINIIEIDKNIAKLQRDIQNHISFPNKGLAQRVQSTAKEVSLQLEKFQMNIKSEKELELFKRMIYFYKKYLKDFNFSVGQFYKKDSLIKDLELIEDKIILKNNQKLNTLINFGKIELFRYLNDPNYRRIKDYLKKLDRYFVSEKKLEILKLEYRRLFLEITQNQRAYLYLINVVMASDAQEFSFLSDKLRQLILKDIIPISKQIEKSNELLFYVNIVLVIIAIVLGITLSLMNSKKIVQPLINLTKTFEQLATGSSKEVIPYVNRNDEIGVMAKSAERFNQKNIETIQLLRELDQNKIDLESSNMNLEQFVYTISHDLKTPIVTSMGYIDMMRDLKENNQLEEAFSKIDHLARSNNKMIQLIDDLLNFSRVTRISKDYSLIDTNYIINSLIKDFQKRQLTNDYIIEADKNLPKVWGNESRIIQVFDHLLSNAIKYAGQNQMANIKIYGKETNTEVLIFVDDNGPGIPKEYHKKIFGLFQRLKSKESGSGIGLSIVQKIMIFHGGSIKVSQSKSNGTSFILTFPKNLEQEQE